MKILIDTVSKTNNTFQKKIWAIEIYSGEYSNIRYDLAIFRNKATRYDLSYQINYNLNHFLFKFLSKYELIFPNWRHPIPRINSEKEFQHIPIMLLNMQSRLSQGLKSQSFVPGH